MAGNQIVSRIQVVLKLRGIDASHMLQDLDYPDKLFMYWTDEDCDISVSDLTRIASYLQIPLQWLITDLFDIPFSIDNTLSSKQKKFIFTFLSLPDDEQDLLIECAERFKSSILNKKYDGTQE